MVPREWASNIFSWISLIFVSILLIPQILHNYRRQTTAGLSKSMIVLWLIGAEIPAVYLLYSQQPVGITISWFIFSFNTLVILCQIHYYNPTTITNHTIAYRQKQFILYLFISVVLSVIFCILLLLLFNTSQSANSSFKWLPAVFGSVLSDSAIVLGFIPQIILIINNKSTAGISIVLILFDLIGCISGILAIGLHSFDFVAILPFIIIFIFQSILLTFILYIYPNKSNTNSTIITDNNNNPIIIDNSLELELELTSTGTSTFSDNNTSGDSSPIEFNLINTEPLSAGMMMMNNTTNISISTDLELVNNNNNSKFNTTITNNNIDPENQL